MSFSSFCNASAKDCRNDLEALYTAWKEPGIVAAIDEVIRTRPSLRATMSFSNRLARWTVDVTLTSMISSSSARSMSTNAPPCPTPALSAAASSGRPAATTAA